MRAYQIESYRGPGGLRLVELPEPKAGFRQVLVRVYATSLNNRDLIVVNGQYNQLPRPQLIPMSDGAGEVVEIGGDVTRFRVGDRVAGILMQTWICSAAFSLSIPQVRQAPSRNHPKQTLVFLLNPHPTPGRVIPA